MIIKVDNSRINADELMERIRKTILLKDATIRIENSADSYVDGLRMAQKEMDSLKGNIQKVNMSWSIHDSEIRSHRRVVGPIIVFFKRAVRKSTFWLIRPYWDQQIRFNEAVTKALLDLAKIDEEIIKKWRA